MLVLMMLLVIVDAEAVTVTVGTALVRVTNCVIVWKDRAISLACAEGGPSGHLENFREFGRIISRSMISGPWEKGFRYIR